jgi:lysophospholipase L1-like esterase
MTGLAILWCLGWLFHTCPYPILFGKYNARYLVFLSALFLLFPLLVYVTTKFFVTTSELKGSRGRKILITPVQKLTAGLVLSIIGGLSVSWLIGWIMGSGVSTRGAHVFHPYLQNVPRPNHVEQHVNRWGFKGNEIELAKPADTYRVFVFGGSTVHCGTVPWEQTHVRMLEKKLREKYPDRKIEVMNLGAEWHCSQHDVIKLLFDAQEFSPDLVVIFHGINDLVRGLDSELFGEGPYRQDYRQYYGAVTNMARRGNTWTMINTVGGHWLSDFRFQQVRLAGPEGNGLNGSLTLFFPKSEPMEVTQWKSLPAFERNMRRFVQVAQEKKYEVLLATQASLYRKDLSAIDEQVLVFPKSHMVGRKHVSLESMTEGMKQFNDVTKQIAEDTKVHFVDLEAAMPKTVEYMYDDVHYTAKGNELIAVELAKAIIAAELVPQGLDARKASP